MKKIALLLTFSAMLIYGQAQIISAIVNENNHDTKVAQVKLYTSPFRDAWPGLTFSDPEVNTSTWIGRSQITANDTMVLLTNSASQVILWKNGELIDISGEEYAAGRSLFVHQGDIYVLWNKMYPYPYTGQVWKNGEMYYEFKNPGRGVVVSSMHVTDSNIYVAGHSVISNGQNGIFIATLWTNGVAQFLSDTLYSSYATSIAVSDSNVYIVGYGANFQGKDVAKLWINGVETNLTTGEQHAQAYSVCVDGEDVYVVGQENVGFIPKPVFWKN
ncbi:hypothetical protein LJC68_10235, partial [Bacteroidales bacterium OttesenSCG-928-B11]|nr:hypothetical protein [Bacteroidales bacterium OttesenSCG-928-B11]